MVQEPLDTSAAVRKLFTPEEMRRIRRFAEGFRRIRYILPKPTIQPIRWPEWVTAIATAGVFVAAIAPGVLAAHPNIRLGLLIATVVPLSFWMALQIASRLRCWHFTHGTHLDQEDMLLTAAAALVRTAELVKSVVSPQGKRASLGHLDNLIHGPTEQRVREGLREGYAGADAIAEMILCLRPPLHSETLTTWARTLRDRVMRLHRAVLEIAVLARTLPEDRQRNDEHLRSADAAYESYHDFWARFVLGSGQGVDWPYSDPLLPDGDTDLPVLRYGPRPPGPASC